MDGEQLLKYQGDLERILCVCVRLRCKPAYTLACSLLEHTLRSLSLIYPTEYRSTSGGFDADLPIRVNNAPTSAHGTINCSESRRRGGGGGKKGKVYYLIPQTNTEVKSSPSARAPSFKRLICEPPQVQISCYQSFYSASSETIRFSRKHKSTTSVLHFLAV